MVVEFITSVCCFGLVYSLTCRASMMSRETRAAVRWAFSAQATAGLALGSVPWVYPEYTAYCVAMLVASTVLVQLVTARLWTGVPPASFQMATAANDSKPTPLRELSDEELRTMWRKGPRA